MVKRCANYFQLIFFNLCYVYILIKLFYLSLLFFKKNIYIKEMIDIQNVSNYENQMVRLQCPLDTVWRFIGFWNVQSWINVWSFYYYNVITPSAAALLSTWPYFSPICWLSERTMTGLMSEWSHKPNWQIPFGATDKVGFPVEWHLDIWSVCPQFCR